ncbi:hypothetical protein SKAU_G00192970 [Synaphobranchus kaupii]|uniref:CCHC-type domain-containing protein n=1 Tax=Synaphobranchus kaupii TaxID=118154 RepID=A0A9Q1FED1_SYNKA|nr:hypothetical protein SKAU_G00192970 [Synaphobranchus kaupii]
MPERLRDHVSLAQPGSISEALVKTTRAEDTLAIRPTPQPTRQHVRVADGEEVRWTRTPLQRPAGRQGRFYRCDEPGHIARDCPAPAPKPRKPPPSGKRGRDGAVRRTPPREPTLLNQVGWAKPVGCTSTVGWTGRPAEPWWTQGLPSPLSGQEYSTTPAGPNFPGRGCPPLTSVTGAKMAMRGKKEGQHHPWHGDCSPPIRPDTKTGPTSTPPSHHNPARKQATPASHRTQATSLTTVPQPDHSLAHHHQPATQQPPAQPKPALPAETTAAVHALWQRSSSGLDHQQRQQLKSLLDGNADLFAVQDEDCTQTELVQHTINTDTAQPIRLRPHRMSPAKRLVAEEKVKEMAAAGVIEPSDSPWAAPAVLVQKKSGDWRFCVDYRRLNSATTKDSYSLPRIDEALDHISGSSWFSSLDLRSGYWQEGQSIAFDQLSAALTEAPVLAYPDAQRPFIVDTDASNTGVGVVLSQEDEDGERVVAYYSRALGKAERNY